MNIDPIKILIGTIMHIKSIIIDAGVLVREPKNELPKHLR